MTQHSSTNSAVVIVDLEDEDTARAADWLERAGHEVLRRTTPIGTSALVLRRSPAVVLVELDLSPLSGEEVVKLIKRHPSITSTPVVLTGHRQETELAEASARCEADGYIPKPYDRTLFFQRLATWLESKALPRRSTLPPLKLPPAPLFVDDDPDVLRAYRQRFKEMPRAQYASSGKEALRVILSESPPDVVVCDVSMPHISGVDVYEIASAANRQWHDRFLFITGRDRDEPMLGAVRRLEVPLLQKPVSTDRLEELILLYGS